VSEQFLKGTSNIQRNIGMTVWAIVIQYAVPYS